MQGPVRGIRKSREKSRFADQGYNSCDNFFACPMSLVAKFYLKILHLDVVNAFMHADLEKTVFMRMPPGYGEHSKLPTQAKYSALWPSPVPSAVAAKTHR